MIELHTRILISSAHSLNDLFLSSSSSKPTVFQYEDEGRRTTTRTIKTQPEYGPGSSRSALGSAVASNLATRILISSAHSLNDLFLSSSSFVLRPRPRNQPHFNTRTRKSDGRTVPRHGIYSTVCEYGKRRDFLRWFSNVSSAELDRPSRTVAVHKDARRRALRLDQSEGARLARIMRLSGLSPPTTAASGCDCLAASRQ